MILVRNYISVSTQSHSFDIVVTDLLMPPPDGIEFLKKVKGMQPSASFAIFSAFLYVDRYRESIRELGFPVAIIDKDFPPIGADDFEARFLKPFVDLVAPEQKQSVISKILASAELKPGFAGLRIDLKKLLSGKE